MPMLDLGSFDGSSPPLKVNPAQNLLDKVDKRVSSAMPVNIRNNSVNSIESNESKFSKFTLEETINDSQD